MYEVVVNDVQLDAKLYLVKCSWLRNIGQYCAVVCAAKTILRTATLLHCPQWAQEWKGYAETETALRWLWFQTTAFKKGFSSSYSQENVPTSCIQANVLDSYSQEHVQWFKYIVIG